MNTLTNHYARLSLISVTITALLATIHHVVKVGPSFIILGLVIIPLPFLLMQWYRRSGSRVALWLYGLFTAWMILGFGLLDGLVLHTIRPLLTPETASGLLIDGTGTLTFIAGLFALYFWIEFMHKRREIPHV